LNTTNICSRGSTGVQPHELENLRRSLAMLNPGATASLSREEAMRLMTDVADLQARLERLRGCLRQISRGLRSSARDGRALGVGGEADVRAPLTRRGVAPLLTCGARAPQG
jgi:hypothetical protein